MNRFVTTVTGVALSIGMTLAAAQTEIPDAEKSCRQLNLEIGALLDIQNQAGDGYFATPGTRIAAVGAVAFEPAWFYLGYAAFRHIQRETEKPNLSSRIKSLRAASADKLCYVQ